MKFSYVCHGSTKLELLVGIMLQMQEMIPVAVV